MNAESRVWASLSFHSHPVPPFTSSHCCPFVSMVIQITSLQIHTCDSCLVPTRSECGRGHQMRHKLAIDHCTFRLYVRVPFEISKSATRQRNVWTCPYTAWNGESKIRRSVVVMMMMMLMSMAMLFMTAMLILVASTRSIQVKKNRLVTRGKACGSWSFTRPTIRWREKVKLDWQTICVCACVCVKEREFIS